MKSEGIAKNAVWVFVACLVVYAGLFSWDRHLRLRHGPWRVGFQADGTAAPSIIINEPGLGIADVKLEFPGESTAPTNATVVFDAPLKPVPFGQLLFDDLMYQPGTITLDLFGHEVELLPRTLIINKKQVPWKSGAVIQLQPEEKLPVKPTPRK